MNLRELYNYKMDSEELDMWMEVVNKVREYCSVLELLEAYKVMIKNAVSSSVFCEHQAGYCRKIGYYYIDEGDRNNIYLKCHCETSDEISRFILHEKILRPIGLKLEMERRVELEKSWTGNNNYDSRKYWFEYVIDNLWKVFGREQMEQTIVQYTGYMNRWFNDEHWQYDCDRRKFVEVSDSKEHD